MAFSNPSHLEGHNGDDNRDKKPSEFSQIGSPRVPVPSAIAGLSMGFDNAGFAVQDASTTKMYGSPGLSNTRALESSYTPPYPDPNVVPATIPRGYTTGVYMDGADRSYMPSYDSQPYSTPPSISYASTGSPNLDHSTSYHYSYATGSHGYAHPMSYPQSAHYAPYPQRRQSTSTGEMMVQSSNYSSSSHYLDGAQRRSVPDIARSELVHRHHSPSSLPTRSESGSPLITYGPPKAGSDVAAVPTGNPNRPLYTHREQLQFFKDAVVNCPMASEAGPFIPQTMYKPHTTSDRRRYVEEVDLEAPIYFWVNHPTECGIPLSDALHSRVKRLQNRDECVFEGRGPSVSIRLEWPGYRQWSRQIPTKDFRSPPGPITRAKLAKNVAKCVQRFISERANHPEPDGDTRFRIGNGPNQIKLDDLILVSIHHVSMGSWQPQLRLRRPLRTPTSTPPLATASPVQA